MDLIKFVMEEIQQIQGEIILEKAMLGEHEDTILKAFENGDILKELVALRDTSAARERFYYKINYLEGKLDAYMKLIKELGLIK